MPSGRAARSSGTRPGHASVGDSVLFRRGARRHGARRRVKCRAAEGAPGEWLGVELERPVGFSATRGSSARPAAASSSDSSAGVDVSAPAQSHLPPVGPLFTEYLHLLQKERGDAMICSPPPERIGPEDALVVVDLQYALLPGGTFGVPEGDHTTFAAGHLIEKARTRRDVRRHARLPSHRPRRSPRTAAPSRRTACRARAAPSSASPSPPLASARRRPRGAEPRRSSPQGVPCRHRLLRRLPATPTTTPPGAASPSGSRRRRRWSTASR